HRKKARLCSPNTFLVEKYMCRGRHKVVGERELARPMRIAAFDKARSGETGAKLCRVKLLLRRELLDTATAVFPEDDNRRDPEPLAFRQVLQNKRRSRSVNGKSN